LTGHQAINSSTARGIHSVGICNSARADPYYKIAHARKVQEKLLKRYVFLYLATLIVLVPGDFLFLGTVAKAFFTSQVGDMLGEVRLVPAILFYLLYVAGILVFVSAPAGATWRSTLLYGALFGLFCYATFELTSLSLLRHWTWPVVLLDVSWGALVTALSSTVGLLVANRIAPRV
jgi:uncharacterized membrane protein